MLLNILTNVSFRALKARSIQLKAVVISERVLGFDHPNTIQQYVSVDTRFLSDFYLPMCEFVSPWEIMPGTTHVYVVFLEFALCHVLRV